MRGGIGGDISELMEGDAADKRQRIGEPFAERHRPPARDLGVDAVVAWRCRRGWLAARNGDRADDPVVVDEERNLAVEEDLGALARASVGSGTGRVAVARRDLVRLSSRPVRLSRAHFWKARIAFWVTGPKRPSSSPRSR